MIESRERPSGVLLMTYGSPTSPDDVGRYLTAVRGGRAPDEALVTEFRRRYDVIGGSPLVAITRNQAAALDARFGSEAYVRAAMRFSEPSIVAAMGELAQLGARRIAAIILSPQYSPMLMGGYGLAVEAARSTLGVAAPAVELAGAWYREPAFINAVAARIHEGLARFDPAIRDSVPVLLTAHSLPRRVADLEPDYLAQLRESAELIASVAGLAAERHLFCWQSAGHEPGEWMSPDFADLMPELRDRGHRSVLVAPIQFLADHLEILYDVEIGAREQAQAAGLEFHRIESLNVATGLVEALEQVARRTLAAVPA